MTTPHALLALICSLATTTAALAQVVPPGFPEPDKTAPERAAKPSEKGAPQSQAAAPAPQAKPSGAIAKVAFGAMKSPAALAPRAIGTYARGCLAGAKPLAIDGPGWQAMRLSRNRFWGHPDLIALIERLAKDAQKEGWPGLLVGDISQPRGGPMLTGHASHQIGLDADVWLTPMPPHRLSEQEREDMMATSMLGKDQLSVNPATWTAGHVALIRRAASYPQVERVLVHPAIKKALCEAAGKERAWLAKVRPYYGHYYHMHIRMGCPAGSTNCVPQAAVPHEDGCTKELNEWFARLTAPPKPGPQAPAKPPITIDQLPAECRIVLDNGKPSAVARMRAKASAAQADNQ